MIDRDLVHKARQIELACRRLVDQQLAGQYASVFRGRGLAFSDVRAYQPGDDVRAIDWHVSARLNAAHVKQFVEERDRSLVVVLDCSASLGFGTGASVKRDVAAQVAGALAISAIRAHDRVGLLLVSDRVEAYVPPRRGKRHVLRIIAHALGSTPTSAQTDLASGLGFLGRVLHKRSLVFLVSDFLTPQGMPTPWEGPLGALAQRHEVIPIAVYDPVENALPDLGFCTLVDLETGTQVELDTGGAAADAFAEFAVAGRRARLARLRRLCGNALEVGTHTSVVDELVDFLHNRARRMPRR